jgi:hypothetical protein
LASSLNELAAENRWFGGTLRLLAGITALAPRHVVVNKAAFPSRRRFDPALFALRAED